MNSYDIKKGLCYLIFYFFLISLILSGKTIETTTAEISSAQVELCSFQQDFGCSAQWNTYLHQMVLFPKKSNFIAPNEKIPRN